MSSHGGRTRREPVCWNSNHGHGYQVLTTTDSRCVCEWNVFHSESWTDLIESASKQNAASELLARLAASLEEALQIHKAVQGSTVRAKKKQIE